MVPPPPSIAPCSAPSGSEPSGPIQLIRRPSAISACPGTGAAPVPSIRVTLRMTTGRPFAVTSASPCYLYDWLLVRLGRPPQRGDLIPVVAVDHLGVLLLRPVAQHQRADPGGLRVGLAAPRVVVVVLLAVHGVAADHEVAGLRQPEQD